MVDNTAGAPFGPGGDNDPETFLPDGEERLPTAEDADGMELLTKLANQQLVCEIVLRSSSMVMRMSLVNFM